MIKILKQLIAIHHEQAKYRKAVRILSKQEWGIEFFALLVQKAATRKVTFTIHNGTQSITIAATQLPTVRPIDEGTDIRSNEVTLQSLLDDAEREGLLR